MPDEKPRVDLAEVIRMAVKDEQTAQLMIAFYRNLHGGAAVAEALREAQLELRRESPNPYYWAAFTVIGDPERRVVPEVRR